MKIEVIKGASGWYFRIKARNGRILAHSESYRRKSSALKAVKLIVEGCHFTPIGEKK